MCLVVILHSLEYGPHLSQRNTLRRQETAILSDLLQFTFRKLSFRKKCAFCMSLGDQTLLLSENSSQREEASVLMGSTWKTPRKSRLQRLVALLNPQEPTHSEQQDSARSVQVHQHVLVSTTGCIILTTPTRAVAVTPRQKVHVCMYLHT